MDIKQQFHATTLAHYHRFLSGLNDTNNVLNTVRTEIHFRKEEPTHPSVEASFFSIVGNI